MRLTVRQENIPLNAPFVISGYTFTDLVRKAHS